MNDIVGSFLFQWWIFMLNFNQLKIKIEHKLISLYEQLIDYDEDEMKLMQYLIFFFPLLYNSFVHSILISYSNETVLSFFLLHQNNKMQHILLRLAICILFLFFFKFMMNSDYFYLQDDLFIRKNFNHFILLSKILFNISFCL